MSLTFHVEHVGAKLRNCLFNLDMALSEGSCFVLNTRPEYITKGFSYCPSAPPLLSMVQDMVNEIAGIIAEYTLDWDFVDVHLYIARESRWQFSIPIKSLYCLDVLQNLKDLFRGTVGIDSSIVYSLHMYLKNTGPFMKK